MRPCATGWKNRWPIADCRLSAIALMELEYGASKRPDLPAFRERLTRLKAVFPRVEVFDDRAAHHTGFVRAFLANLKPNAQPIGAYDTLLAGHALALGAAFVTHNTKEFSRVPELSVENWQARQIIRRPKPSPNHSSRSARAAFPTACAIAARRRK